MCACVNACLRLVGTRRFLVCRAIAACVTYTLRTAETQPSSFLHIHADTFLKDLHSCSNTHTHTDTLMRRLWTAGKGNIIRPPPGETFFLPQRPYCTLGTLREQLLYPKRPGTDLNREELTDDELLEILRKVGEWRVYVHVHVCLVVCGVMNAFLRCACTKSLRSFLHA